MSVNPAALKLPGVENHPKKIVPRRMTLAERFYLPLLGGLVVTIRHMFQNLLRIRKRVTIEYPEERREYSPRYRGHHILTTRPDGSVRCVRRISYCARVSRRRHSSSESTSRWPTGGGGAGSVVCIEVTRRRPRPSLCTVQTSRKGVPPSFHRNASRVPSGDQVTAAHGILGLLAQRSPLMLRATMAIS